MHKYAVIFSIAYIAFNGLLAACMELFDPKLTIALGFAVPLFGCFVTAMIFARNHQREPSQNEVKILSWLTLVGVWVISLSLPIVFSLLMSSSDRETSIAYLTTDGVTPIMLGSITLSSAIAFAAIRLMFSLCVKLANRNSNSVQPHA